MRLPAFFIAFAAVQISTCYAYPQIQHLLDSSPFSPPRRPRGGPLPSPGIIRPRPRNQRQLLRGPPNNPLQERFLQNSQELPGIGPVPVNPRTHISEPRPHFFEQESEVDGDFVPIIFEEDGEFIPIIEEKEDFVEKHEEDHENDDGNHESLQNHKPEYHDAESENNSESPLEVILTNESEQDVNSREDGKDTFDEEPAAREGVSILHEKPFSEPDYPFRSNNQQQRLEEQASQDFEFLSAPPENIIRKRNTARPQRPAHPNQIPVYHEVYNQNGELVEEGDEVEEEEPDRLAILLLDSKFTCVGKNNGYYADEDVNCEVFHYCQDRVKHSWLCPEGASFHQVHLICMPRSEDNICARSSTFHFVNDFLYKELEGPNKTYADRYYPEGFADGVAALPKQQAVPAANNEGYQTQINNFPGTQKTRRPSNNFQNQAPPVYHPGANVQHSEQSFQPEHGIIDRVQQSVPEFQQSSDFQQSVPEFQQSVPEFQQSVPEFQHSDHFGESIGHNTQSFQPSNDFGDGGGQGQFSAFHSPEEVRVQRPRFRPGRRPGGFKRPQVHIG